MTESSTNEQKTLWEEEKLLFTSNFSFFHSIFKRLMLQTRKNKGLLVSNSLPNDKIFDWSKFNAFADDKLDKINVTEKLKFFWDG